MLFFMKKNNSQDIFVNNLKMLMDIFRLKPADVAKSSGVSPRMIAYILDKERSPNIRIVEDIARAFKLQSWHMMMPSLDYEIARTGKLDQLVDIYTTAEPSTQQYIGSIIEREAGYTATESELREIEAVIDHVLEIDGIDMDPADKQRMLDAIRHVNKPELPNFSKRKRR